MRQHIQQALLFFSIEILRFTHLLFILVGIVCSGDMSLPLIAGTSQAPRLRLWNVFETGCNTVSQTSVAKGMLSSGSFSQVSGEREPYPRPKAAHCSLEFIIVLGLAPLRKDPFGVRLWKTNSKALI